MSFSKAHYLLATNVPTDALSNIAGCLSNSNSIMVVSDLTKNSYFSQKFQDFMIASR